MKKLVKKTIGKTMVGVCSIPAISGCIKGEGYVFTQDYNVRETANKSIDIRDNELFARYAKEAIESGKTCLGYERLYTIFQGLSVQNKDELTIAEVGVYKGGTSRFMCDCAFSLTDKFHLHGFDTFDGHHSQDISEVDAHHKMGYFSDTNISEVARTIGYTGAVSLWHGRFQDKCHEISEQKFDFIHLDVDIYEPTLFALVFFSTRLNPGALIVVDDYGVKTCPGVQLAVDEFITENKNFTAIHLLSGQALIFKRC